MCNTDMSPPAYRGLAAVLLFVGLGLLSAACFGSDAVILATTTSTRDSGLLDTLVPAFEEEADYNVRCHQATAARHHRVDEKQ